MKTGKIILGVLIGTTAGALLGMLFAPRKTAEARKRLAEKSRKYAKNTKQKFDNAFESISKKFNKVKQEVDDFSSNTQKG